MNRTILVVLLVVGTVGSTAVPTGTTADVGSQAFARESTEGYPPGVNATGVTDPLALADAHRKTLENTSYAMTTTYTFQRTNGSVLSQGTTVARAAAGGEPYYVVTSQSQRNASHSLGLRHFELATWANETRAVMAEHYSGTDPTYRQVSTERTAFQPSTQWQRLYSAFAATNTTIVSRFERNGTTLFRIVSAEQPGPRSALADRTGYSLVAIVDSHGVVRTLQTTYRTTFDGRPAVVSHTMHVTNLGNTTVERPAWYRKAVTNESGNATV